MKSPLYTITLFLLVFLLPQCKRESDVLEKYSYIIKGYTNNGKPLVSTGSFIKKNNLLYLLTANHVICGCGNSFIKESNFNPNLYINIVGTDRPLIINTKAVRDSCDCHDIDFSIQQVDSYFTPYVNSIEKTFSENSLYDDNKDFAMYGYHPTKSDDTIPDVSGILIPYEDYNILKTPGEDGKVIPYIASIAVNKGVAEYQKFGGYSGSPAFIKDANTNSWKFKGVFFSVKETPTTSRFYLIKADTILNRLKTML